MRLAVGDKKRPGMHPEIVKLDIYILESNTDMLVSTLLYRIGKGMLYAQELCV